MPRPTRFSHIRLCDSWRLIEVTDASEVRSNAGSTFDS
jgi:hypothetical protein